MELTADVAENAADLAAGLYGQITEFKMNQNYFPGFVFAIATLALAVLGARGQSPALAPDLASDPAAISHPIDPRLPTIFIAGDSTAAKNNGNPVQGWGEPFHDYFDSAKVNVVNLARGGRSSRTFTKTWPA